MKNKKLEKMDLRDMSLMVREIFNSLDKNDLKIQVLLGFFRGIFLKIIKKLNLNGDTFMLNLYITDYIKQPQEQNSSNIKLEIKKTSLPAIFAVFKMIMENPYTSEFQLIYLFGFSQGLPNQIMRKLEINYLMPLTI